MERLLRRISFHPGDAVRQTLRANIPGDYREYFKVVIGIKVLNTIITDLRDRFGEGQLMVSKMLVLNLKNLVDMNMARIRESLEEVVNHFNLFFPSCFDAASAN